MDFGLNDDQKIWRDNLQDFLEKEMVPIVEEKEPLGNPLTKEEAIEVAKKFKSIGLSSNIDDIKELASDPMLIGITAEEIGRTSTLGLGAIVLFHFVPALIQFLPDEMEIKKRLLSKVERSELIGCYALTEPEAGSDNKAMKTTAVLDGDEYIINGSKTWVSNAPIADVCMLVAKNEKGELDLFLLDREKSPFETSTLHKMGLRLDPTGEMFFEDCHVPKENNLTNIMTEMLSSGEAVKMLEEFEIPTEMLNLFSTINPVSLVLAVLRTGMALASTGISQACLDASVKYAKERVQFGRPIGKFQLVQDMIYKIATITETSRLLGYKALNLLSKGDPEFRKASSMAKAYACGEVAKAAFYAIEIHGGMGLSTELPVERYYRDARMMTIPDGTMNLNKLIVGREILGKDFSAYV